ncbi:histidine kinase [Dictyobacter sp. S3.2.2.5]|uniref:histidine kinase n=1 Tax=Dictyobacter halimunensis TaxID=3026934 RepID=A0ABQ6FNV1_9CHLR|nr:histidine kinase [Dictyobacter sp. S3.2.2.5]
MTFLPEQPEPIDLQDCAREPIHIPGAIQPHGVMLILDSHSYRILQVSSNSREVIGRAADALLGESLEELLAPEHMELLRSTEQSQLENNPLYLFTVTLQGSTQQFDGIVHTVGPLLILELEPSAKNGASAVTTEDLYAATQTVFSSLRHLPSVKTMSQLIVEKIRQFTGFDRVMMYRFEADDHGVVIAESKRADLETFLDLHYPESDIPAQARRLYVLNWLRLIANVDYTPAPLLPTVNPLTQQTVDMSHSVLRSVSPIHIEYLKNMGVESSMSISIVKDERLWGLIACHHYAPKYVPYNVRTACELLGRVMSLQLPTVAEQEDTAYRSRLAEVRARLIEQASTHMNLVDALTTSTPTILDAVAATGAAICMGDTCHLLGQTPTTEQIHDLLSWLEHQPEDEIFSSDCLSARYPDAQAWTATASGVLALILSKNAKQYLLWFRPEVKQTVQWAGEPTKIATQTEQGVRLSPRKSFEKWSQIVQGHAQPWNESEVRQMGSLRAALMNVLVHKAEQLAEMNRELERSNQELDAFTYIASHDLKEPLRGIRNYANFLKEDYGHLLDQNGTYQVETLINLSTRMESLMNSLLYYSRLGRTELPMRENDLNEVLADALSLLRYSIEKSGTHIHVAGPLPTVYCDSSRISEVFLNLISNALKYGKEGEARIEIGVLSESAPIPEGVHPPVLYVRDNGIGIPAHHYETIFHIYKRLHGRDEFGGGTGVGLAVVKKIIALHKGAIWLESREGEGTTFYFTVG